MVMVESEHIQAEQRRNGRKFGPLIALVALVVVIAGGAFAYNGLTHSDAMNSGAGSSASASGAGSASASASGAGSSSGSSFNSTSRRDGALYLSDRDSTVYTETGAPLSLSTIAAGKPLVINFWATWCPYCIQEMDDFQAIYNDYGNSVSFAFIDCVDGQRETVESGARWMREQGLTLPAYYDTSYEAVRDFGASSLPTTVVVGADGEILAVSVGAIDPTRMRNALDALLES